MGDGCGRGRSGPGSRTRIGPASDSGGAVRCAPCCGRACATSERPVFMRTAVPVRADVMREPSSLSEGARLDGRAGIRRPSRGTRGSRSGGVYWTGGIDVEPLPRDGRFTTVLFQQSRIIDYRVLAVRTLLPAAAAAAGPAHTLRRRGQHVVLLVHVPRDAHDQELERRVPVFSNPFISPTRIGTASPVLIGAVS